MKSRLRYFVVILMMVVFAMAISGNNKQAPAQPPNIGQQAATDTVSVRPARGSPNTVW